MQTTHVFNRSYTVYHADPALFMHLAVSAYKTDLPCSVATRLQLLTTYTCMLLPMHINMHYTPSTIPTPLPSTTLLCTQVTNTKHSWRNGTRCRDAVKVLWCHSHLVWLVYESSIPTYVVQKLFWGV